MSQCLSALKPGMWRAISSAAVSAALVLAASGCHLFGHAAKKDVAPAASETSQEEGDTLEESAVADPEQIEAPKLRKVERSGPDDAPPAAKDPEEAPPPLDPPEPPEDNPADEAAAPAPDPALMQAMVAATQGVEDARRSAPDDVSCSAEMTRRIKDNAEEERAVSDALASWHWEKTSGLSKRLRYSEKAWVKQRWVYLRHGVCEPELFVLGKIVDTTFFGYPITLHVSLVPKLKKVEALMKKKKKPRFGRVSAFSARTVRGPGARPGRISNHAFGRAIDFDPRKNPYFTLKELKLIEEISGVKIKRDRKTSAARRWRSLDRASKRFKKRVRRWIRVQRTKLRKEKRRARRKGPAGRRAKRRAATIEKRLRLVTKGRNLTQARKTGLMTFSQDFVVAMEKAGFVWGIHFGSGADVMHFANH